MNVLHVIPAVAPRYGGPSQAVLGMGRVLTKQGVNVCIATTDADGPGRLRVAHGAVQSWQGVPAVFFPRQWSEAFKYSGPLAAWLGDHVTDFDVVHVHAVFSHACLAAANACRSSHVPYIVRPLGTLDPWSLRQKPIRKRLLWHLGVNRMLDGAAAIHYTTTSELRLAEKALGLERGVVIPLGVDDELFTTSPDDRRARFTPDPFVLTLGRLHPKKGLELFIEVFLQFAQSAERQRWRLVVAGDGDPAYVAKLKHLVAQRRGEQHVQFTGWLAGTKKAAAMRDAALLALPSKQENFGIVVAEALACGTPVLVSPHVNLADEVAAANAGWVVPIQREALLAALSEAARDDAERQRRGAAGRHLAQAQFNWQRVAADLGALYSNVSRN